MLESGTDRARVTRGASTYCGWPCPRVRMRCSFGTGPRYSTPRSKRGPAPLQRYVRLRFDSSGSSAIETAITRGGISHAATDHGECAYRAVVGERPAVWGEVLCAPGDRRRFYARMLRRRRRLAWRKRGRPRSIDLRPSHTLGAGPTFLVTGMGAGVNWRGPVANSCGSAPRWLGGALKGNVATRARSQSWSGV